MTVNEGLDFILSHFEQPIWPRKISTKQTQNKQVLVNSNLEALNHFKRSRFEDCRISAFSEHEKEIVKPNLIFVDLDNRDALNETLILFHKELGARPLVLDTGNGYAIIQPIRMNSWNDKKILCHKGKQPKELSKIFLQWAERYLTNYKCDLANHPSLGNTMIRIPDTYNTKLLDQGKSENTCKVKVVFGWDNNRVKVNNLPFKKHVDFLIEKERHKNTNKTSVQNFKWIEKLFDFKLKDGRERILYDVTRYLINLKGYSMEESTQKILSWLDSRYYSKSLIRTKCKTALNDGRFPRRLCTIKNTDPELYALIPKEVRI